MITLAVDYSRVSIRSLTVWIYYHLEIVGEEDKLLLAEIEIGCNHAIYWYFKSNPFF